MKDLSNIKTVDDLLELLCSNKNKSGCYSRENNFKLYFPDLYNELLIFIKKYNLQDLKFVEQLYRFINSNIDDIGICKNTNCNNYTKFRNIKIGYAKFCCAKCAQTDDSVRDKQNNTNLIRYGAKRPAQSKEVLNKMQQTCLERYNSNFFMGTDTFKEKSKETCLEKYGDENYRNVEKAEHTCLERYGVKNVFCSESEIRNNAIKTCLELYGKEYYTQTDECKEKFKNYEWVQSIKEKRYNTLKQNNSFNTSKIEEQIKSYLNSLGINYEYQYISDQYPFNCDFYFPDNDLYIEIQGSWTHGGKPFDNTEDDQLLLEKWKSKNTDYYNAAIETWTIRDVMKRETAKQNNLNYLEIFSCDLDYCIEQIKKRLEI